MSLRIKKIYYLCSDLVVGGVFCNTVHVDIRRDGRVVDCGGLENR